MPESKIDKNLELKVIEECEDRVASILVQVNAGWELNLPKKERKAKYINARGRFFEWYPAFEKKVKQYKKEGKIGKKATEFVCKMGKLADINWTNEAKLKEFDEQYRILAHYISHS